MLVSRMLESLERLARRRFLFAFFALCQAALIYHLSSRSWSGSASRLPGGFSNLMHLPLFGLLGGFLALALGVAEHPGRRFRWVLALALAVAYGFSDEVHQSFVPDRRCSLVDVVIDLHGSVAACLVVAMLVDRGSSRFVDRLVALLLVLSAGVYWCLSGARHFPDVDGALLVWLS